MNAARSKISRGAVNAPPVRVEQQRPLVRINNNVCEFYASNDHFNLWFIQLYISLQSAKVLGLVGISYICYQLLFISIKKIINDNLFMQTTHVHYIHNNGNCCSWGKGQYKSYQINHINLKMGAETLRNQKPSDNFTSISSYIQMCREIKKILNSSSFSFF